MAACFIIAGLAAAVPYFDASYSLERAAIVKRLNDAKNDGPRMSGDNCALGPGPAGELCVFGTIGAKRKVVLFGDSHAQHLFDGLNAVAVANGWELHVWVRGSCPPIEVTDEIDPECIIWNEHVVAKLSKERPGLVILSSWTGAASRLVDPVSGNRYDAQKSTELWKSGFRKMLDKIAGMNVPIVVVRDTPASAKTFGTLCLETRAPVECATPRSTAVGVDAPDVDVAQTAPGVELLDLSDRFCDAVRCPAVKDGIFVYRADNNHITATMSLTLKSDFDKILTARR
jgi:hypothetical protein